MKNSERLPGTIFSPDRLYRYTLTRVWDEDKPAVAFIGLNPSTADEVDNDPTIRKCIKYAKDWGYGALVMLNVYAYRSTDWKALKTANDPYGKDNDAWLMKVYPHVEKFVACWGNHVKDVGKSDGYMADYISAYIEDRVGDKLTLLAETKQGQPWHPLYLSGSLRMYGFNGEQQWWWCKDCGGRTLDYSDGNCSNPSCPLMPCCDKTREECKCENRPKPVSFEGDPS